MPPKVFKFYSPEPINVTLSRKEVFSDVIKLRILRWGDYPALSKWAQCNHKDHKTVRRRQKSSESEMWKVSGRYSVTGFEDRSGESQAKEHGGL